MVTTNSELTTSDYSSIQLCSPFIGWEEKYNTESSMVVDQVFKNETYIQTRVNVLFFNGKLALRTANSHRVNGRYVDTFYPVGLSDMMISQLTDLGIRELEVQLKIVEQIDKDLIVSCCVFYEVTLLSILKIDEVIDLDQINSFTDYTNFVIEGKILNYEPSINDGYLTLVQQDGNLIKLFFNSYGIGYENSTCEKTFPVIPFLEDLVQASIYYDSKKNKYIVDSIHLLEECELRKSIRNEISKAYEKVCEKLKVGITDFGLNELLSQNVDNSNRTLLNSNQIETIKQIILDNHGEVYLPFVMLLDNCDLYQMKEITKVYNVPNVYTMTLGEFLKFCEDVACCRIQFVTSGSYDYHFRYLHELVRDQVIKISQFASILHSTIDSYSKRIMNKNYLTSDNMSDYTENDYAFGHVYLLEQAISYASDVPSFDLIKQMLNLTQTYLNLFEEQVNSYDGVKCNFDPRHLPTNKIASFFHLQFFTFRTQEHYLSVASPFLDFEPKIDELCAKITSYQSELNSDVMRLDHYITCMGYALVNLKEVITKIKLIQA
jgi:hypothetical protein